LAETAAAKADAASLEVKISPQAGAESDAGPKQPSSLRGHAEPKQPNGHHSPEANV